MAKTKAMPTLPDILDSGLSVVFCGLNPGLRAAETGHHFAGRSNRFWQAMHLAGFTPELIHPSDDREVLRYGCGLTTVVERPTARADEVSRQEFKAAHAALELKIAHFAPRYLAFLGKAAYCAISDQRDVSWGPQHEHFAGAAIWVLPNPSGLNRAFRLVDLVRAYRELCDAASPGGAWMASRAPCHLVVQS
ncbi:MAG: G/U mismatch-specific DNA glycosylase [Solimonas sp.]